MTGLPRMARLFSGLRTPKRKVPGLDLAGTVVDTQVAKIENLAANSTGSFEIKSDKPKVAAWRYAPIK